MHAKWAAYAPLPLRLVLGWAMASHGIALFTGVVGSLAGYLGSLGVPAPGAVAWAVTLLEMIGGVMLVVGALVGVVSVLLILNEFVTMGLAYAASGGAFANPGEPGFMLTLLSVAGLLTLALGGAGAVSLDATRQRRERGAD